jgi:hypothetical protein
VIAHPFGDASSSKLLKKSFQPAVARPDVISYLVADASQLTIFGLAILVPTFELATIAVKQFLT